MAKEKVDKLKELLKAGKVTKEQFGKLESYDQLSRTDKEFVDKKFAELMEESVDAHNAELSASSAENGPANPSSLGNAEGGGKAANLNASTSEAVNTSPSTQTEVVLNSETPVGATSDNTEPSGEVTEGGSSQENDGQQ